MTSPQLVLLAEPQDRPDDVSPPRINGGGARVVLYTSSDCWRGAGISYIAIAEALDSYGFRPRILATHDEVANEFRAAGVPVDHVPGVRRGEARRLRTSLGALDSAAVIVDRVHDLRVGTIAVAGTRQPLIFRYNHFHGGPPADAMVRIAYWTVLRELVFLSASARERVLRETPFMRRVRSTAIPEGVDAAEFRPCPRAAAAFRADFCLGSEPFVLAVGALAREKEYDALLDALHLMGDAAPRLVILGEGNEGHRLRARACALALDVRFLGRIPRCAIVGAYSAANGLVHAGSVETFGLAVLEAMACARPVVVSAGGALPEVVGTDGSCGTLVTPRAPREMAVAIGRLLDDPERAERMGVRARERARQYFSLTAMQRSYALLVARHVGYHLPLHA